MESNMQTYRFIVILTGLAALLLSMAATGLKDRQDMNRELDRQKNILKSVGALKAGMSTEAVQKSYSDNIHEKFVTADGQLGDSGSLLFIYGEASNPKGYILPISGKGLWSTVNGYFALQPDCNTVMGITFFEHGETPGLGGEIEKEWFTSNFENKKIYNSAGELVSIAIAKAQVLTPNDHEVDGISGATLTTKGVADFLLEDLKTYEPFFARNRN